VQYDILHATPEATRPEPQNTSDSVMSLDQQEDHETVHATQYLGSAMSEDETLGMSLSLNQMDLSRKSIVQHQN
jgi:hypothetical protein